MYLTKPARVGNTTFGIGVAEREVIEAAQRLYAHAPASGWVDVRKEVPPPQMVVECAARDGNAGELRRMFMDSSCALWQYVVWWRYPVLLPNAVRTSAEVG